MALEIMPQIRKAWSLLLQKKRRRKYPERWPQGLITRACTQETYLSLNPSTPWCLEYWDRISSRAPEHMIGIAQIKTKRKNHMVVVIFYKWQMGGQSCSLVVELLLMYGPELYFGNNNKNNTKLKLQMGFGSGVELHSVVISRDF